MLATDPRVLNGDRAITDDGAGLGNSSYSSRRRAMLDTASSLYDTGVTMDIEIPMIGVLGIQSSGKSSLIESASGITLPRASGTCTRCPTECRLRQSSNPWQCTVSLRFSTNGNGEPIPVRTEGFGDTIYNKDDVAERVSRAQRAILHPSKNPESFLEEDEEDAGKPELTFSKNCIVLEISGPNVPDLSFVDLPGIISSVGSGEDARDIELIKELASDFVSKDNCIILLTIACETDFMNQGAYQLATKFDPRHERTIGVLTKPDKIDRGDEDTWLRILRNEDPERRLKHGWYMVKQPDTMQLRMGITWEEARQSEKKFFLSTQPWAAQSLSIQRHLGTELLTQRCGDVLSDLIATKLPGIRDTIYKTLQQTEAQLKELPGEPSKDPVGEVYKLIGRFSKGLSSYLEGTPGPTGLLQLIRPNQQDFRKAIRSTAPDFRPYERPADGSEPEAGVSPDFLANEEMPYTPPTAKQAIYINEVMEQIALARTRELPDFFPFEVIAEYVHAIVSKWREPTLQLFDKIESVLNGKVKEFVNEEFAQYPLLLSQVTLVLTEHISSCSEVAKERLDWLLEIEQRPRTWNEHYYRDYREKFLTHYKGSRPEYSNMPLLQKLKSHEAAPDSDSSLAESISKITAGFSEIGIHGVKPADLPKVLPSDPCEAAISIMASVRAYFQVAYKRFADNVPNAIDHELILGLNREQAVVAVLRETLGVGGPDGFRLCSEYVKEDSVIALRREELKHKRDRLLKAQKALWNLQTPII
ncbi:uncharacterized protein LAESUDRAFT_813931 [Laetiporus sulphureus 93-53]|uniref:P-loop containing nucleoside triphosphate hydrolase protein n=1 Tax=Laetiporus sulphureus 93-53 TaxID=1314785 RepID=A0A165DGB4_9APHY|nr:uncharacterized protein LAESUDRAFT_813931 [Laetiporus sulphureus 93-53]KZT04830.1 hypothetical protein LAESUDRAFT_813931 [Laetiporus sulphureus 93-53]